MTDRLYYTNADLLTFDATVRSSDNVDGRAHVVLDRTAFYPTSGGQPFDTGTIGGAAVLDVFDRDDDGEIVHVVERGLTVGAGVRGEIDAARRLDHMQQHTGQHVLSAAFVRTIDVATVSFHLGAETSTIDLAREVTAAEIARGETEANRVVWEDRPVTVRFVSAEEAAQLPLRKTPVRTGSLRLVDIANFDLSACGGTHVARTGMIGVIAVSGWERFKGATRISFVCGGRALAAFRAQRDALANATRVVSVSSAELAPALERLQQDARAQGRALKRLQESLAKYRGAELRSSAETIGPYRGVLISDAESDAAAIKVLASAIVEAGDLVAVVTGAGQPVPVVVTRSGGVQLDAGEIVRELASGLGGRGGGRPELAQGGIAGTPEGILARAREILKRM